MSQPIGISHEHQVNFLDIDVIGIEADFLPCADPASLSLVVGLRNTKLRCVICTAVPLHCT